MTGLTNIIKFINLPNPPFKLKVEPIRLRFSMYIDILNLIIDN